MYRSLLLALTVVGAAALPAQAQPEHVTHVRSAADLASVCDPRGGDVARLESIAYCQGFITSFVQYHALAHPAGGRSAPLFCVSGPGPSIAESGLAFARWTENNPQHRGEPALDGLLRWAEVTHPCAPVAPAPRRARR